MMRAMMIRFVVAALGFVVGVVAAPSLAVAQSSSDLLVRIDQLENQVRQLTGLVEQMQYRNQQLEALLKRVQEDTDYRFQELGRGGPRLPASALAMPPRPAPPPVAGTPPAAQLPPAPASTGRHSDAFDPSENPTAPGAPRALGSIYGNAPPRNDGGAPGIMAEEALPGRQPGAPLDLATMPAPAGSDPSLAPAGRPLAGGSNPPLPRGPIPSGGYAVATAPPTQSPRDSFDMGYGYMQRRDYALAAESFRDFLRRYPADRMAADAQYWLAESLYLRQSYRDAADAFLVVSKKYETSPKAPDALLRLGQSLAAISEKELACATFGEVVRKYPRVSPNVRQAVEREQKRVHC